MTDADPTPILGGLHGPPDADQVGMASALRRPQCYMLRGHDAYLLPLAHPGSAPAGRLTRPQATTGLAAGGRDRRLLKADPT